MAFYFSVKFLREEGDWQGAWTPYIKLICFAARALKRVTREADVTLIDEEWCLDWYDKREAEEEWENKIKDSDYPRADPRDSLKVFELNLAVLLDNVRDGSGVPLTRVVRDNLLLVCDESAAPPMCER